MITKDQYLGAMRAEGIPAGWSGLWHVHKYDLPGMTVAEWHSTTVLVPPGTYTCLYRLTDSTLYNQPPGECVMEDTPQELSTHLGFVMKARGSVLVTGLGLGCVLRGLLLNPKVTSVTCIEKSQNVMKLVSPYLVDPRLEIIMADALDWAQATDRQFDCAWHDIWTDRDAGEPHLDLYHGRLLLYCKRKVGRQGAWGFSRQVRHMLQRRGLAWIS